MEKELLVEAAERFGTPLYVYDVTEIRRRIDAVKHHFGREGTTVLYAVKANPNAAVLRLFAEAGWGADVASPGEGFAALRAGFPPERIIMTGTNLTEGDLRFALRQRLRVNLDSVEQVELFGRLAPNSPIWLRMNPEIAPRTHPYLATAGPDSKFGIRAAEIEETLAAAEKHKLTVTGLHCHIGSMLFEVKPYLEALDVLLNVAEKIETVESVDTGGGMGHDYGGEKEFDWDGLSAGIYTRLESFRQRTGRQLKLYIEVGRWAVAAAGWLLTRVVTRRQVSSGQMIGVDCPFTQFIRPALYGAAHRVVNLKGEGREKRRYFRIVGNACENGDILARDVELEQVELGDLLAFCDAGAYCAAMASCYNGRPLPAEVVWDGEGFELVRRRGSVEDLYSAS